MADAPITIQTIQKIQIIRLIIPAAIPQGALNGRYISGSLTLKTKKEIKEIKYKQAKPNADTLITTFVRPVVAAIIPTTPAVISAAVGVCLF